MSCVHNEKKFNDNNEIMMVNDVPQTSHSSACIDELLESICSKDWDKVIERVEQKAHVRLSSNNMNQCYSQNLPLEIECQASEGSTPLFKCLMFKDVPFNSIQCIAGNHFFSNDY